MYVLLILMILLLVAAIVYVGLRAIRWLRTMFDFRRTYVLWIVLVLLPLLFVVGDFLPASGFARAVTLTGGVSIGLFLYALLFTAAADLLALLLRLTPLSRRPAFRSRKTLRVVGCAVLALSVCVSVYGVVNAATIDRTTYSVSFENGADDGMRIALISDLHLGSEIGSAQMCRVVEEVNACEADIVVIGSPLYWHNICGSVRNVLDRFYGKVENGSLSGRKLYFVFQGAAPEKWMLEAGEYTMKRFAALYGMTYGGMATNKNEATKLGKNI